MKITADDLVPWACGEACEYITTMYPNGVEVDEPFLRRWVAREEWVEAHWTDLARAAVQFDPSIVFTFANMALEYASRAVPTLTPLVGTVVDIPTARAAARAGRAVASVDWAEWVAASAEAAADAAEWAADAVSTAVADAAANAADWAVEAAARADAESSSSAAAWATAWATARDEAKERIVALCIAMILEGERG